jgi:hypothetical protein
MLAVPECNKCSKKNNVKLRRNVISNGDNQVFWYCTGCKCYAEKPARWLHHALVNELIAKHGATIANIPILSDYRDPQQPCAICGEYGTEYNHWMPQMLAEREDVAPEWPRWADMGAYLCRKHHILWHDLVTPWMPGHRHGGI